MSALHEAKASYYICCLFLFCHSEPKAKNLIAGRGIKGVIASDLPAKAWQAGARQSPVFVIYVLDFDIVWDLEIGIWNFFPTGSFGIAVPRNDKGWHSGLRASGENATAWFRTFLCRF